MRSATAGTTPLKKTLLTAAAVMAMALPAAAQTVQVGIAAEAYPPFARPDASGNWVGWEVEMIGAICAAAELLCEIVPVAWDGIIPSQTSGQINATQADSIALDAFLASEAGTACCESKGAVADDPKVPGVGVGLRKREDELKAGFNAGIAKVLADGTHDKISAPFFASSICDG